MKNLSIIGSGMAGLLAANMLRRHRPVVHEKSPQLPDNHTALLRFRNLSVSDATGIPFKKIRVSKSIYSNEAHHSICDLAMANSYSHKVTGEVHRRSILNLEEEDRYLAPHDFIQQMANSVEIQFGSNFEPMAQNLSNPIISTIPMPLLMKALGWPEEKTPDFAGARQVITWRAEISWPHIGVHQTVYFPDSVASAFRATLQGNLLIVELVQDAENSKQVQLICNKIMHEVFGIDAQIKNIESNTIHFGKIAPIPEDIRKEFITWATEEHNIYSLGRFATWRPGLLLDSLPQDIKVIERLMLLETSKYEYKLKQTKSNAS